MPVMHLLSTVVAESEPPPKLGDGNAYYLLLPQVRLLLLVGSEDAQVAIAIGKQY